MTAGAVGSIITNPLWVIKTRFMVSFFTHPRAIQSHVERKFMISQTQNLSTDPRSHYSNTFDAFKKMYRSEGVRGFYRGLIPSLIGVIHVAVQFPLYEKFKTIYRPTDGSPIPPETILFCSSVSKVIASVTCYPHEVVRTRLQIQQHLPINIVKSRPGGETTSTAVMMDGISRHQTRVGKLGTGLMDEVSSKYSGVSGTIRNVWRNDGWRGFYSGLGVNLIRTVPATALTILS
jgi:solute carrier family 25 (mitochondrial folate transporter), member 32